MAKKKDKDAEVPAEPITRDDIVAKFKELEGAGEETVQDVKTYAFGAIAAIAVLLILIAFLSGKKRGAAQATVVEIRRI